MKRRLVVGALLASGVLLALGAGAAVAATPSPTPSDGLVRVLHYTGATHTTADDPHFNNPASYPSTVTVDCTHLPCQVTVAVDDSSEGNGTYSLNGGAPLPFTPGRGPESFHVQQEGANACADDFFPAGTFTVTATDTQITLARTADQVGVVDCSSTETAVFPAGYTITTVATLVSGSGCLAVGDCPTPSPTPTPTAAAGAAAPLLITPHPVKIAEPSTLSVLPTAAVALNPANIVWAAAATVVLVLLIALPSHLLNTATETGSDRLSEWWKATRARARAAVGRDAAGATSSAKAADPPPKPVNFAGWPIAAGGVLIASLISSFIDPSFGFNAASIRVFLSILLSFLLDAVLGWFLLIVFVRRANPEATARFRFAPASLVVVLIAVLFTRLTGFQPGIVFGLVAGVVFGAVIASREKARLAMITLGYSFVLAVIAWVAYSAIAAGADAHPGAAIVFVQETLSAMAIGGIAALPIALVPLRGLAGYDIWHWNRGVWAGAYALGLIGFFVVLMPKPFSWATVGLSVWTWGGIFAAYAVGAVVLWLIAARPWRRSEASGAAEAPSTTIEAG